MNSLSERLEYLIEKRNLDQEKLATLSGVSQSTISNIINGVTRNPRNIVEIANALDVDPLWLKSGEGDVDLGNTSISSYPENIKGESFCIQNIDIQALAGCGEIINPENPEVLHSIYFSKEGLLNVVGCKDPKGVYLINIPSDSMQPTINKGDIVFVDTKVNQYTYEGIYVFDLNGHTYIKRLQRLPTNEIQAISDNPIYPPFIINEQLFNSAVIRGKFLRVLPINPRNL